MFSTRITGRFLTGGLAAAAVTASFAFASPALAASGDERPCGSPAVDAVYSTLVIDPIFRTVPAVTHLEWRWQRDVTTEEYQYSRETSPAYDEVDWTREVPGPDELLFHRTVIDWPGMPAIPGTPAIGHFETVVVTPAITVAEDEYQHQVTGKLRWESPDWGAQNGEGNGWVKTGNHRDREITPAVTVQHWVVDVPATPGTPAMPAITHVESQWATSSPGGDWTGPFDSRPGSSTTENQTTSGDAPAGSGWVKTATRHIDAVLEYVWAATAPGDDWTATGDSRVADVTHEETPGTTATAPDGDGWTTIDGSEVTVVDVAAHQDVVTPGSIEQILVSPALPATDACPSATIDPGGPVDPDAPGDGGGVLVSGPQAGPTPSTETPAVKAGGAEVLAPEAASVLPNTGGVPGWLSPVGLASIAAGVLLVRNARRRASML